VEWRDTLKEERYPKEVEDEDMYVCIRKKRGSVKV